MDMESEEWATDAGSGARDGNAAAVSHLDDGGMQITGRQKGVDVVKELRDICLEHETSSPVENPRLNCIPSNSVRNDQERYLWALERKEEGKGQSTWCLEEERA